MYIGRDSFAWEFSNQVKHKWELLAETPKKNLGIGQTDQDVDVTNMSLDFGVLLHSGKMTPETVGFCGVHMGR